ncbi:MAG: methyltransferase domain-containing protein [bacterium]
MNNPHAIADLYDRFLDDGYALLASDPKHYPLRPVMERVLRDYPSQIRGKTVLDLGCGPGLLKGMTDYDQYAGVDVSQDMLKAAALRGYSELVHGALLDFLPTVSDASYDSVICFSVAYFLDPEELSELVGHMQRVAGRFWLLTLDRIPPDLAEHYMDTEGIRIYDHTGLDIPGAKERFTVPGWKSATDGKQIPVEVVIGVRE